MEMVLQTRKYESFSLSGIFFKGFFAHQNIFDVYHIS